MCDICGENPQQIQLGNMETGEQKFICAPCAARWGLDFAKGILPAEEIAQVLGPMFVAGVVAENVNGPGKARKGRKAKAEPEPPPAEEPQAAETAEG